MAAEPDTRIPVTVVTGALGSGKTTLLNHLLTQTRTRRLAVIVNEFGDAGIDGDLIESDAEELIELSSGCLCCVVRGDLIRTLRDLARREPAPDGVLIETTGLANPSPVIQTFSADQILAGHYRLDSVVTLVDALHITSQLAAGEDAVDQIALADLLVLNKTAQASQLAEIENTLRTINPVATILRTDHARVAAADLFDRYAFDASRVAEHLDELDFRISPRDHIGAHGITSVSILCDTPLDPTKLEDWLTDLLSRQGPDMLRIKGIVDTGDASRLVIQAVHMLLEGHTANAWSDGPRRSRIVFIGRNLDAAALRRGVHACAA